MGNQFDNTPSHRFNRSMVISDNLQLLQTLDDESVDLVVTDPPFAKGRPFSGVIVPELTDEERALEQRISADTENIQSSDAESSNVQFDDTWHWDNRLHNKLLDHISEYNLNIGLLIDTIRKTHSNSMGSYLLFMAARIIEMRRVLKPTGQLYLHCDPEANSYLRIMLDTIFGADNFRNEIVWCYGKMSNETRNFARNHDTILRYTKSDTWIFNPVKKDESEYRNRYKRYLRDNRILYEDMQHSKDKLITLRTNKIRKQLGRDLTGQDVLFDFGKEYKKQDDIINLSHIKGNSYEKTGYPTQKPVALAEILIMSSSNPGDVVLDPFAGSGYVAVAAEQLNRQWILCDRHPRALTVARRQFAKLEYQTIQNPLPHVGIL